MRVRSDGLQRYSSARSLGATGRIFLDANERQTGETCATYGRRQNPELVRVLSKNYGVSEDSLIYDRGLDEIISLIFRACCDSGSSVRTFTPTYGMYAVEASIQGLELDPLPLTGEGFLDLESLKRNPGSPSLVILCRPNNPLGTLDPLDAVIELLELYKDKCPVFVDEAYAEFTLLCGDLTSLINTYDLIIGRTLSKAYGLAGLRLGCALSRPQWIERLATVQKPYPVSKMVEDYLVPQFEVKLKPEAESWIKDVRKTRSSWKKIFSQVLKTAPFDSETNFITFRSNKSHACYEFLRERGIVVRVFTDNILRITIGTDSQLREIESLDWKNL